MAGEEVSWEEVVQQAYFQRVQLWAAGFYRTEGLHWDSSVMQGSPFKYFAYGVAATEVEVDGFTGAYRLRRVDIVHDVGDSLSPLVDLGQIEGGFVQGAGWLTLEDLRWDERDGPDRGRLATQAASTYKLPSFSEMPEVFNVALLEQRHEEGAVYGSKAVGEPPLMLAFSVREALRQAAAAFGPAGTSVDLGFPGHPGGGVLGDRAGPARPPSTATLTRARASSRSSPAQTLRDGPGVGAGRSTADQGMRTRHGLAEGRRAAARRPAGRRAGHASPPSAGTPRGRPARRWSSAADATWGIVGGGNLEAVAIERARALLGPGTAEPELLTVAAVRQGARISTASSAAAVR